MTEQELRALVREAVVRHLEGRDLALPQAPPPPSRAMPHPSLRMFALPADEAAEGRCIIEPAVMCSHCGYCKSFGH
jgi:hypothetical protein